MDIEFLLAIQQLRLSSPYFFELFFEGLSYVGNGPLLIGLVLIVYWCFNKRAGQFAFIAFSAGNFCNQLIKNTVCAYRPWIREPALVPPDSALKGATGYSFPSGHTTGTTTSIGSFGWLARKNYKWITVASVCIIVLMMFARLYMGVHTPQDVFVGLIIGLISIALTQLFFNWIERCDAETPGHNKDILTMAVVLVMCAASIVFVLLKPYPIDYVEGVLLVDPVEMQKTSFEAAGIFASVVVGWVLERRFVAFTTESLSMRTRVIRLVVGIAIVGCSYLLFNVGFKAIMPANWAKLFVMFIVGFMAVFVAPFVFSIIEQRKTQ